MGEQDDRDPERPQVVDEGTAATGDHGRRMTLGRDGGGEVAHMDLRAPDGGGLGDDVDDSQACGPASIGHETGHLARLRRGSQ